MNPDVPGCLAAESDFGSVNPEDSRVAARSAVHRGDQRPRNESEVHEPRGQVGRKIDMLDCRFLVPLQIRQRPLALSLHSGRRHVDTMFHITVSRIPCRKSIAITDFKICVLQSQAVSEGAPKQSYSRGEVCRLLGVSPAVLEAWEARGLLARQDEYLFRDLIALRTLQELRRKRFRPERVSQALESLRERLSHIRNPLTELKILTDGRRLMVAVEGQKMEAISGQLVLDFDRAELNRLLQFPARHSEEEGRKETLRKSESQRWFDKGLELESAGAPPAQILLAYRRAVEIDPDNWAAHVNLGTNFFHLKKWADAEQHYKRAIEVNPRYAMAHFNLANLYDEKGDWVSALEHYLLALQIQPGYPDAHYNLALLYQTRGELLKAVRHWKAYLKADPTGYWAGIARRELAKLREGTILEGNGR